MDIIHDWVNILVNRYFVINSHIKWTCFPIPLIQLNWMSIANAISCLLNSCEMDLSIKSLHGSRFQTKIFKLMMYDHLSLWYKTFNLTKTTYDTMYHDYFIYVVMESHHFYCEKRLFSHICAAVKWFEILLYFLAIT